MPFSGFFIHLKLQRTHLTAYHSGSYNMDVVIRNKKHKKKLLAAALFLPFAVK
jgi:hypothetical protein